MQGALGDSPLLHFLLHTQSQKWLKCFTVVLPQNIQIPRYHFKTAIYFSCTHPCRIVILMAQQSKVAQETEVGAVQVSSPSRPPRHYGLHNKTLYQKYPFKNYPNLAISYKLLPWQFKIRPCAIYKLHPRNSSMKDVRVCVKEQKPTAISPAWV